MSEPPGNGNGDDEVSSASSNFPEDFQGYETTFFGSIGRAQLWGADPQEQSELRDNLYTGWIDNNASYWERRQARADYKAHMQNLRYRYSQSRGIPFDDRQFSQGEDPDFDWAQWAQEYHDYRAGYY